MMQQTLKSALQHHQAGRLREAEQLYRQILGQQPQHADAINGLGAIAAQTGQNDTAEKLFRRAVALKPSWPEAHHNLALVLKNRGRMDEAITAFRAALALRPNYPSALFNLGASLEPQGDLDSAIAAYGRTVEIDPNHADAWRALGNALRRNEQHGQAVAACRRAVALAPRHPDAHSNLGDALLCSGQLDEAIAAYRQAITLNPRHADAHCNLAQALAKRGELDAAIETGRHAIALHPHPHTAWYNLGYVLNEKGQPEESIAAYRQAIVIEPDFLEAHENLGTMLLMCGQFEEGWKQYEWRWKLSYFPLSGRHPPKPVWQGEPLEGRTILLHEEYGFGDTIQFLRFLPLIEARGGKIIVECLPKLERLIQLMPGNHRVVPFGQPLPPFDLHCPLMGLPKRFGTELETIPRDMPYLRADAREVKSWKGRLASLPHGFNIGLCWAASPAHNNHAVRSIPLSTFGPLASIPGARFFSLQHGAGSEEAHSPPKGMQLIDWTAEFPNFDQTAALVANLDLVISIDTAALHVAGALGRPVWILLPLVSDWRWLMNRDDSPWYPSARLFRQTTRGDWAGVMQRLAEAISAQIASAQR